MAFLLAFQWGILDVKKWIKSLPKGALDQWLAFDLVEPMGERWMQTATLAQSIELPLFAQAGKDAPEVESYMPRRYLRKTKRISELLPRVDQQAAAKQLSGMIRNSR
jgi:hypothetical protein